MTRTRTQRAAPTLRAARAKQPIAVAIQGEPGSFSEEAARRLLGSAAAAEFGSFEQVAAAVAEGVSELGLLPASNSVIGRVVDLEELFARYALEAVDEITLPIHQCLIASRRMTLREVQEVWSHPVALAQCRRFLERHPWMRAVAVADTAGAVRDVCASPRRDLAAIAGSAAARLHGGTILRRGIADRPDNATRFVLFRRKSEASARTPSRPELPDGRQPRTQRTRS